jgi:hypothetical protein
VLAWVKRAEGEGEEVTPLRYIPLSATDADGWLYRATVHESGGRLVVGAVSLEAPQGAEGNMSAKLRAVSVPAILEAAAAWDAELRAPDQARLRREMVAFAKQLADAGEVPADLVAEFARELRGFEFPPTPLLSPDAYERIEGPRPRRARGRVLDRNHYARVACMYLEAARVSHKPNVRVAEQYRELDHPDWKKTTDKMVADWKRIASGERFGFLRGKSQGRGGAEPTEALREWAETHADEPTAQIFLQRYGKGER